MKAFNDTRKGPTAEETAIFEAKLNGTYVRGDVTGTEVAPTEIENLPTFSQPGASITYIDEMGVERTTHSGLFLLNI